MREIPRVLAGVFVGGRSTRMGRDKATLALPEGQTLEERALGVCRDAGLEAVRVGGPWGLRDRLPEGPLGGLRSLLTYAVSKDFAFVLALACDMPHVDAGLVRRLAREPECDIVDARAERDRAQPLCARYAVSLRGTITEYTRAGGRSLRGLYPRTTRRRILHVSTATLHDWDAPADIDLPGVTL